MARLGKEYLTSNELIAHPFASGTEGVAYLADRVAVGAVRPKIPADAILDALIMLPNELDAWYLHTIESIPANGFNVLFGDTSGGDTLVTLELPTPAAIRAAMSGRYYILTAEDDTVVVDDASTTGRWAMRAVFGESFVEYLETIKAGPATGAYFKSAGVALQFAAHVIERTPPKLESFAIYSDPDTVKQAGIVDDVQIIPGYNINTALVSGSSDDTAITLSAVPGAGDGVVPCDEQEEADDIQRTPMGLVPDATGSVRIESDECYEIIPKRSLGQIEIHGTCYACCTCDDYVDVAQALAIIMGRTHDTRLLLDEINSNHTDAVDDYNDRHFPALRTGFLSIIAVKGISPGAEKHGNMAIVLSNKSESSLDNLELTTTLSAGTTVMKGMYKIGNNSDVQACTETISGVMVPKGEGIVVTYRVMTTGASLNIVTVDAEFVVNGRPYSISEQTSFT